MQLTRALKPAAAMAALCFLTISTSQLRAQERLMDRLITVSATGYATAEPDQAHLGEPDDPKAARALRTKERETFVPGKFICPHGACFDHAGNIYVVEWVEVGRVTKLRKV